MSRTVLFLESSARVGGTETVLVQLMERLDRSRFRPILCCLYEPGTLGRRLLEAGYPVAHSLGRGRWDPRIGWRLLRLMRRERVEILFIVNQPLTQFWGISCALLAGVKVRVMAVRSTGKINRVRRRLWVNRLTLPWVTRVTALSRMHQAYLTEQEGIPAGKIEVIPNGVDLARFQLNGELRGLRGRLGIPETAPLVGIVAMLRPEKNHEIFLRAAARVMERVPEARFVVVGDGPERPRLERVARSAGVESRVIFLGVRQDVPAIVALLDVAVLCSHSVVETMSNAVLEYMAAAKPVVATRVGSIPEQVEEGKTGFLVGPGDAEGLADRIVQLLQDPVLRRRMGEAGRERVRDHFTLERMVAETGELFERLAAGQGA